jgi:hypothetical protein
MTARGIIRQKIWTWGELDGGWNDSGEGYNRARVVYHLHFTRDQEKPFISQSGVVGRYTEVEDYCTVAFVSHNTFTTLLPLQ